MSIETAIAKMQEIADLDQHGRYGRLARDAIKEIRSAKTALEVLLDEAERFGVSGVYFDEKCFEHKGPDLARAALAPLT
jgi:hypothetical protein